MLTKVSKCISCARVIIFILIYIYIILCVRYSGYVTRKFNQKENSIKNFNVSVYIGSLVEYINELVPNTLHLRERNRRHHSEAYETKPEYRLGIILNQFSECPTAQKLFLIGSFRHQQHHREVDESMLFNKSVIVTMAERRGIAESRLVLVDIFDTDEVAKSLLYSEALWIEWNYTLPMDLMPSSGNGDPQTVKYFDNLASEEYRVSELINSAFSSWCVPFLVSNDITIITERRSRISNGFNGFLLSSFDNLGQATSQNIWGYQGKKLFNLRKQGINSLGEVTPQATIERIDNIIVDGMLGVPFRKLVRDTLTSLRSRNIAVAPFSTNASLTSSTQTCIL